MVTGGVAIFARSRLLRLPKGFSDVRLVHTYRFDKRDAVDAYNVLLTDLKRFKIEDCVNFLCLRGNADLLQRMVSRMDFA